MIIAQLAYFDSNQDPEWLASFYDAETFLICKEKLEDKCYRAGGFLQESHLNTDEGVA